MTLDIDRLLDPVGWQILSALQEDARLSFAEIGRQVGLSLPAVAERVRRMEEAGIITGYHAQVNGQTIGRPIMAFVRINMPGERYPAFIALAHTSPEVLECHHLSGADSFILKVIVSSIPHLETLVTRLGAYGQTTTSIVLSSPLTRRNLEPESPVDNSKMG